MSFNDIGKERGVERSFTSTPLIGNIIEIEIQVLYTVRVL
jgi:hypothetical protein